MICQSEQAGAGRGRGESQNDEGKVIDNSSGQRVSMVDLIRGRGHGGATFFLMGYRMLFYCAGQGILTGPAKPCFSWSQTVPCEGSVQPASSLGIVIKGKLVPRVSNRICPFSQRQTSTIY